MGLKIVKDRYSLFMLAGSVLVISGFTIWWYATSVVSGLGNLVDDSTTQQEESRFRGALEWWRDQQTLLFNPLATLLIAVGIVLIGNAFFWLAKKSIEIKPNAEARGIIVKAFPRAH